MDKVLLGEYGIDLEKGLINCMGDEAFFAMLLSMFLQDDCFARGQKAFEKKDYKALFACMHELKGVSGNAALTGLYHEVVLLVELLRTGAVDEHAVDAHYHLVAQAYDRACLGIRTLAC